ncbi:MAG: hypothetical protein NTZ48_00835 [Candidatus Omnitrophica bacterium]|nr:hypothetical protein [Candidatus Omnitrophota bacterium]
MFNLAGCATAPELNPLQRRVMEAKELEGTYDGAFKATITVLQDKSYIIKSSDYNAGLISAESGRVNPDFWTGRSNRDQLTINIEKFTEDRVKMRISIFRNVFAYNGVPVRDATAGPVGDPKIYQDLYAEIQKEIFRRTQLNK